MEDIDAVDSMGKSALSWAALRGDDIAVNCLLKAGANANLSDTRGFAALSEAIKSDSAACVKLLLDANADIHHCCRSGINAIHYAARHTNTEEPARLLVRSGLDPDVIEAVYGTTPLGWAANFGNVVVAATLLDLGADINFRHHRGDTPLSVALFRGSDKVVELLLQRGADYTVLDSNGDSILHLTAKHGGCGLLDILMAAKLQGIDPHSQNREGKTAIKLAQSRVRDQVKDWVKKPDSIVKKMYELVMDIDAQNSRLAKTQKRDIHHPATCKSRAMQTFRALADKVRIAAILTRTSTDSGDGQATQSLLTRRAVFQRLHYMQTATQLRLQRHPSIALFGGLAVGICSTWLIYSLAGSSTLTFESHRHGSHVIYLGDGTANQEL